MLVFGILVGSCLHYYRCHNCKTWRNFFWWPPPPFTPSMLFPSVSPPFKSYFIHAPPFKSHQPPSPLKNEQTLISGWLLWSEIVQSWKVQTVNILWNNRLGWFINRLIGNEAANKWLWTRAIIIMALAMEYWQQSPKWCDIPGLDLFLKPRRYADDTTLTSSEEEPCALEHKMNYDLNFI